VVLCFHQSRITIDKLPFLENVENLGILIPNGEFHGWWRHITRDLLQLRPAEQAQPQRDTQEAQQHTHHRKAEGNKGRYCHEALLIVLLCFRHFFGQFHGLVWTNYIAKSLILDIVLFATLVYDGEAEGYARFCGIPAETERSWRLKYTYRCCSNSFQHLASSFTPQ
jgi:hypothetical protein